MTNRPLADKLRPVTFDDIAGQKHLISEKGVIRRMVSAGRITNMIFYGPPGTGKTTVANIIAKKWPIFYQQLVNSLNSLGLNVRVVKDIGRKIYEMRELRNEAAHGGKLLDIVRARKAQDVTFIHTPNVDTLTQINIADQCHELIIKLLKLFE